MEAANASRQARLRSLREVKDQQQGEASSSSTVLTPATTRASASALAPAGSKPIHPFRRAFLSQQRTALRPSRSQADSSVTTGRERSDPASTETSAALEDLSDPASSERSAQRLVDSSTEGQLLRRFRNWDPMTGQARSGAWNTVKGQGIEDEVAGVQESVLREEEERRNKELDLAGIAPKRVNWDLKRDMIKRLKKLEKRDRETRLILIRQRLKSSKSGTGAVNTTSGAAEIAVSIVGRGRRGLDVGQFGSDEESDVDSDD